MWFVVLLIKTILGETENVVCSVTDQDNTR
jgi:hypothetical protein